MKFLLDHDVPDEIGRWLGYWRYDVKRLREVLPVSTADDVIFDFAQAERRVIITCNRNHFSAAGTGGVSESAALRGLDHSGPAPNPSGRVRPAAVALAPGW